MKQPVADRRFRQARGGEVMGQGLRLALASVRKPLFERFGDARMQLLSPAFEERLVGGVLDQRVLETVGRLGRRAVAEHQLGGDELI